MSFDPVSAALDLGGKLIDHFFPDPTQKAQAQLKLLEMAQNGDLQSLASRAGIITAEAQSESWITRSWRPITMLTFVSLVVAYWLGFTAPNIGPETVGQLLEIVKIGLGGYVVGRSAEKVAENLGPMLKK